jgi:DNA-binding NtrC family response regulator
MGFVQTEPGRVNVLASEANWAWPRALQDIFRPRGVNLLVAHDSDEFVNIISHQRISVTIIDAERPSGIATVKIIRINFPFVPCILLAKGADETLLDEALKLDVFSVIDKPVDMDVLRQQLNRLFVKRYNSDIFNR